MLRFISLAIAAVFAWCAILQYNDPDPWLWIAVYAAAATVGGLAAFGRYPMPALLALSLVCLVWMALLVGGVVDFLAQGDPSLLFAGMSPDRPYVEQTREFGGLAIILLSCAGWTWLGWRDGRAAAG